MDYELVDSGNKRRLERFGKFLIDRPDPQIVWDKKLDDLTWSKADARFERTYQDKGKWIKSDNFPESWIVAHDNLKFKLRLTPFKHTGVFPEQAWEWDFIIKKISETKTQPHILNLFAYTGGASLAALSAGAKVTHLDASKPAISWFKENQALSGLADKPVRVLIDDSIKFTAREINRGVKYDGVILDPPVYGHGPKGEKWRFNEELPKLLDNISKILSSSPLFVIINAYAVSTSSVTLANILKDKFSKFGGNVKHGELTIEEKSAGRILSTGIWAIWENS